MSIRKAALLFVVLIQVASVSADGWVVHERVVGKGFEGVTLERVDKAARFFWVPTNDDVIDMEKRLPDYLKSVSKQYTPPIIHPEDYKRYYQGILTSKGHKRLNVYFFPQSSKNVIDGTWLKNYLLPQNYWQVVYDMEDKRFYELISTPE